MAIQKVLMPNVNSLFTLIEFRQNNTFSVEILQ